ncbi:MAG: allene oxide cyclase family protein [Actinomycetota bacterium]
MRAKSAMLLAGAALAATAITVSLISVAAAGPNVTRIQVVERATTDAVVDLEANGDSSGDLLTFHNEIYDEANQHLVGSDQGDCVRIEVGVSWECRWVTSLADGSITVEGPLLDGGPSVLAVTGGTGIYRDVSGSMRLVARDEAGTEFDFIFRLLIP